MQKVPEKIRSLSHKKATQFYNLMKQATKSEIIEVGQIWTTHSVLDLPIIGEIKTSEPKLVIVLANNRDADEQVTVAPISVQTWAATDFDFIIPEDKSPLGYSFMIEVWNETPALTAHLKTNIGNISIEQARILREIRIAHLLNEDLPMNIKTWVGMPLFSESDIRISFQEKEIEAIEYLANSAIAMIFEQEEPSIKVLEKAKAFKVKPIWGNISDYLNQNQYAAASSTSRQNNMIITHIEDNDKFIFELLVDLKESRVYLLVHELSPSLEGKTVNIILDIGSEKVESEPTLISKNSEITVGNIPSFKRKNVVSVEVKVK